MTAHPSILLTCIKAPGGFRHRTAVIDLMLTRLHWHRAEAGC